jgi:hypothetical protein
MAVALVVAGLIAMDRSGYHITARLCAIQLVSSLPFSVFIFALSMVVANMWGTGLELANFSVLIPKALLLILFADLCGPVPCFGGLMALAVWFIGAIVFFHMEAWEARFLVLINWALNWGVWMFVVGTITKLAEKPH